jgi:hypothetical protein
MSDREPAPVGMCVVRLTRRLEGGLLITVTTNPDVRRSRGMAAKNVVDVTDAMGLVSAFLMKWSLSTGMVTNR